MEVTTMGRASLNMRMRMGMGQGVKEHSCKNGDRLGGSSTCKSSLAWSANDGQAVPDCACHFCVPATSTGR